MISKSKLKFIKSLQIKKYRQQEQSFLVEGAKSVLEVLKSDFKTELLLATPSFIDHNRSSILASGAEVIEATENDLVASGNFESNKDAIAVVKMKPNPSLAIAADEFVIVLDDTRDPGNLGTIIRIADWYGIFKILASPDTVDCYNPKVISASMGSFTRVQIQYTELPLFLRDKQLPVFGAFMEGESVHKVNFGKGGLIVIGNEAHGISVELEKLVSKKINIPRYGKAESLNAAIAAAVICDNLRRGA